MLRRLPVALAAALAFVVLVSKPEGKSLMPEPHPQGPAGRTLAPPPPAVRAGALIFVSALSAPGGAPGQRESGDAGMETRRVLARLAQVLEDAGSSLGQSVAITVYLKRAADFEAMNAAYREAFTSSAPPTRTTIVADLELGTLVAMSAVALPAGAPREVLHPKGWIASPRPYSTIVRAGGLVFFSGLVSRRGTDDQVVPGSAAAQTKTILDNARTLLQTAGLGLEDVVASRVFITSELYFAEMNDVYRTYFPNEPPARATAVTGLMGVDYKVEITLVATTGDREVVGPNVSPSLPLSSAIRTGNLVYLSGVLGNTEANARDVAGQTREAMARVSRTLESAGLTFADLVDTTIYLPDIWQAPAVHQVYAEFFAGPTPARTTVGAGLVVGTGLVELMMVASKGSTDRSPVR